jgi:hypothetical protein
VDVGHIGDGNGLGHGQEDAPSNTRAGEGVVGRRAGAIDEAREAVEGGLERGGNARKVHRTAQIPVRLSWRSVVCGARVEHRMPWLPSMQCRAAPQLQCTPGALGDSTVRPRRCWRPAWNTPLSSSRAPESGRASSQAEAGQQAQLRSWAQACVPSLVPGERRPAG